MEKEECAGGVVPKDTMSGIVNNELLKNRRMTCLRGCVQRIPLLDSRQPQFRRLRVTLWRTAIRKWTPESIKTLTHMKAFLGLAQYYAIYMPN